MIRFGEIERYVGNLIVDNLLGCDLGVRGDLSTPAKPDAGFLLKCGLDDNFQPAGARGCIFVRNSDSVRDYDKLSQKVPFPQSLPELRNTKWKTQRTSQNPSNHGKRGQSTTP